MKKKFTTFDLRTLPVGTVCHLRGGGTTEIDTHAAPTSLPHPEHYPVRATNTCWYMANGCYWKTGAIDDRDIIAVEVDDDTPAPAMSHNDQTNAFADDLDKLVERYRQEFEITYAQVVGCLQLKIHTLCAEAASRRDEVK